MTIETLVAYLVKSANFDQTPGKRWGFLSPESMINGLLLELKNPVIENFSEIQALRARVLENRPSQVALIKEYYPHYLRYLLTGDTQTDRGKRQWNWGVELFKVHGIDSNQNLQDVEAVVAAFITEVKTLPDDILTIGSWPNSQPRAKNKITA